MKKKQVNPKIFAMIWFYIAKYFLHRNYILNNIFFKYFCNRQKWPAQIKNATYPLPLFLQILWHAIKPRIYCINYVHTHVITWRSKAVFISFNYLYLLPKQFSENENIAHLFIDISAGYQPGVHSGQQFLQSPSSSGRFPERSVQWTLVRSLQGPDGRWGLLWERLCVYHHRYTACDLSN